MAIPNWALGRHLSSCIAQTVTIEANGDVTTNAHDGNSNFAAHFVAEEIEIAPNTVTENIVHMASLVENEVPLEEDDTFVIHEIMRKGTLAAGDTQYQSILPRLFQSSVHVFFTVIHGLHQWTFTGVMADYTEGGRRGKNICSVTVKQIGGGVTAATTYDT